MKTLLLLIPCIALIACGKPSSAPLPKIQDTIPVQVAPVTQHTQAHPITTTGVVAYKQAMTLSFKIGGIVQTISVNEGDRIQKGQVIARLSQNEIAAQVTQAKSTADKAKRDLQRFQKLYQDAVITTEQVQNATTAYDIALANLKIARFNQQHALIYAPANGYILRRFVEPNELVGAGTPILHVTSDEQQRVLRLGLTDRDLVSITLGDTATVHFDAYPNRAFQAQVSQIAQQAHPQTGTFEIELTLSKGSLLKSGFIGRATLYPSVQQPHLRIPLNAIVEANASTATIYIPNGNHAQRVVIHPQHIANHFVTVPISSAQTFTHVITTGSAYLQDGSRIQIQ